MRRLCFGVALVALALAGGSALANTTGPLQGNDIPFGSQSPGSTTTHTLTIQNTDSGATHTINSVSLAGTDQSQFNLTSDTCSTVTLDAQGGANDHCTVDVQFKPTSTGSYTAQVDVSYDGGGQNADISDLTGSADVTSVNVTPGSLNFGSHAVSALPISSNVTVTNNGTVAVTIASSSISSGGSDFSQDNGCTSSTPLAPGGHCQISVSFVSSTAGSKSGNLQIVDTAPSSPENVPLSGTATAPAVGAAAVSFGNVLLNHSSSKTLTVNNTGTAPLVFGAGAVTLATGVGNYTLSSDTCSGNSIAAGQSCTVNVTFSPTLSGAHPGSVSLADNAPNSPQSVALSGAGLSQFVSITPNLQDYGSLTVGRTGTSHVFTVKNLDSNNLTIGASPLTIVGTNPKSFTITGNGCANQVVAPNGTCTFTVQFTPGAAGALSAQLREADGSPDSPHTVALTGTGVHPVNVTNLHGSVGCSTVTMLWTPAAGQGLVGSVIRRSDTRIPRSPLDGTLVPRTRPGVLLNGGLRGFHTYYYAIWSEYRFAAGHPIVYSGREWIAFRTGELCKPQNHAVISSTRPTLIWRPVAGEFAYGLKFFQHGSLIFQWAKLTTTASFRVPASWTFRGVRHSLKSGGSYTIFVYAYTRAHPGGFKVGKYPAVFSIK